MRTMRILISNDDGILAPGIAALRAAVADMGEIHVVAPDSPQSAAGHAITLTHPLTVRKIHVSGGIEGTSIDGRPADCVRLAIRSLLPERPDLVLAGINAGANVGINVFYSGTVAAAAEAAMFNIPAVAFSASMATGEVDFARAAHQCRWVLDNLLADGLAPGDLINVNIPAGRADWPIGVRVARQSTDELDDEYIRSTTDDGVETYRLSDKFEFKPGQEDTDVAAILEGYITVTPLHVDMTQHNRLPSLKKAPWKNMPD